MSYSNRPCVGSSPAPVRFVNSRRPPRGGGGFCLDLRSRVRGLDCRWKRAAARGRRRDFYWHASRRNKHKENVAQRTIIRAVKRRGKREPLIGERARFRDISIGLGSAERMPEMAEGEIKIQFLYTRPDSIAAVWNSKELENHGPPPRIYISLFLERLR